MRKLVTDRQFYRNLMTIALPIALQNLMIFAVGATDTLMLGRLGDVQISASAQANQPQFLFSMITFGLAGGGSVLVSQYWGKGDIKAVKKVIAIVLRIAFIASLVITAAVLIFPRQIMMLYLKDEVQINEAVRYLKIVGYSYIFFGISNAFMTVIRSVEIVKISVVISFISFVANAGINYVLIFGKFGAPAMGIQGAAIGTLSARIIEFILIAIYAAFVDKKLKFRIKDIFARDKELQKDYVKYSIPVVGNEVMWAVAISLQAAILGHISSDIVTANSIGTVLQQFACIVIFGVGNAACVVIGKKIGENDMQMAKNYSFTIMIGSIILGIIASTTIFVLRKPFVSLYNITEEVRTLTENLLVITSIIVLFVSVSATAIMGVLRGAGDTKFSFVMEMTILWGIALPLGTISAFVVKAPPLVTFALLKIDEPLKAIVGFTRMLRDKTYKNVTK